MPDYRFKSSSNVNITVGGMTEMNRNESVRLPYVAGQFYEENPERLLVSIDKMYRQAADSGSLKPHPQRVRAMILPHAGYVYSGATAVKTVAAATGRQYRRIVVIAPSHRYPITGIALPDCGYYQTPLGRLKVDTGAVDALRSAQETLISRNADAHTYEHALEVELPILQKMLGEFELLPLICGSVSATDARAIAAHLLPYWQEDTLWVISSDFTHYGRSFRYVPFTSHIQENLRQLDLGAVDLIRKLQLDAFEEYIETTGATICGCNPIKILLAVINAAKNAVKPELVDYTTSGELTGDFSHCVSYAGMIFSA